MVNRLRWLGVLLILAVIASACTGGDDDAGNQPLLGPGESASGPGVPLAEDDTPLLISLSADDGEAPTDDDGAPPTVDGLALDDASIQAVLDRLEPWQPDTADQTDFNRPAETIQPPQPGETVDVPFPPPPDAPAPVVAPGALEVVRFQPDGGVDIAPFISITFNQPMVPVGTLAQVDAIEVPATITPEISGRWQWIGTRTLRFDHDSERFDRLPMASSYTVDIPAGTTSVGGGVLATAVQFEFETPAPTASFLAPDENGPLPLEPVFLAAFDQFIEPEAVLASTTMRADGATVPTRLATEAEITEADLDGSIGRLVEGRYVAFRPVDALPKESGIEVSIGPDTPSAEGPGTSPDPVVFSGRTFGPLRIIETECDDDNRSDCNPDSGFWLRFNNPLDSELFSSDQVTIEPALPAGRVSFGFDSISIRGPLAPHTTYRVAVSPDLTDVFGQRFGDSEPLSFEVGGADARLRGFRQQLITLDPGADVPAVGVSTVNYDEVRVRMFDVEPSDWSGFDNLDWRQAVIDDRWPWNAVVDRVVDTNTEPDVIDETLIDLSDGLNDGLGHLVVLVEPAGAFADLTPQDDEYWRHRPTVAWVQSTGIALDAFVDDDGTQLLFWTTDLATGEALADVEISGWSGGGAIPITTDDNGFVGVGGIDKFFPIARKDGDVTFLPTDYWDAWDPSDRALWHTLDDRTIYKPGETVRLKGWVRSLLFTSDATLAVPTDRSIPWALFDSRGNELDSGTATANALGGFDFSASIPDGANLGIGRLQLTGAGGEHNHAVRIEEFRRPEFEVSTEALSAGPHIAGDSLSVAVQADYFSGGPLPDADVDWLVGSQPATYSPPDWDEFTFGVWVPWWFFGEGFDDEFRLGFDGPGGETEFEEFSGRTDASGSHRLLISTSGGDGLPTSVTASATVIDVNRQAWSSSTPLLIHPGEHYVGLRSDRTFVRSGDPLEISAIVTDIEGEAQVGRSITVEAGVIEWRFVDGEWTELVTNVEACEVTSAAEPGECSFSTSRGGRYRITAAATDDAGRSSRTELTRWVSGRQSTPDRRIQQEEVLLIPDAETYQPGDTAEILVQAPFAATGGRMIIARNGIESSEIVEFDDGTAVLEVPITDSQIPGITVQVDAVGASPRTRDDGTVDDSVAARSAYAVGQIFLSVPPLRRELTVVAEPADSEAPPGAETSVDVAVTDASGDPVADAEFAVVVVDEALLALSNFDLADPIASFYNRIGASFSSFYGRDSVLLTDPAELSSGDGSAGGDDEGDSSAEEAVSDNAGGDVPTTTTVERLEAPTAPLAQGQAEGQPITVRSNFDAVAVFEPTVTTDASGKATIAVPLPDNLTRYRIMVTAVSGAEKFGIGESAITARLPLQVRPSPPRFLNFGDRFELPVVVQNQTDSPLEVDLVLEVSNLVLPGVAAKSITVPANDRVEVRFDAEADQVGTARFRVSAVSAAHADSATLSLPVYTPATTEAFATYGVLDSGAVAQSVLAPVDVIPQFGGLEVSTSSTAVQALTDAVIYLSEYRYESADALASRIMGIVALRDVLEAFDAEELPSPSELEARIDSDIDALAGLQNFDGGFGYWRRDGVSLPYASIQTTHALVLAEKAGYTVPTELRQRALTYLSEIEFHIAEYSPTTRFTLRSYALNVLELAGAEHESADDLFREAGELLQFDAMAWLWPSISSAEVRAEIERRVANATVETAAAATFTTDYGDEAYVLLHSSRRTDGIVLESLISTLR